MLQKRADTKYHSAGLWANSCCGHPTAHFPVNQDIVAYEDIAVAATRRLFEELGLRTKLRKTIEISYNLLLENGLYENEYVHIFVGRYDGMTAIVPNIDEVSEIRCLTPEAIRQDVHENSDQYAAWFRLYVMEYYENIFALSMHWH